MVALVARPAQGGPAEESSSRSQVHDHPYVPGVAILTNHHSRSMAALYINLAEYCKRYFSSDSAVQEMLDEFVPLAKQEMIPTAVSILISFLPLDKSNAYMPALFKIWEATNSTSRSYSKASKIMSQCAFAQFLMIVWWNSSGRSHKNTLQPMARQRDMLPGRMWVYGNSHNGSPWRIKHWVA